MFFASASELNLKRVIEVNGSAEEALQPVLRSRSLIARELDRLDELQAGLGGVLGAAQAREQAEHGVAT